MRGVKLIEGAFYSLVAAADSAGAVVAPNKICYMPEGISEITPFVDGKAQKITVRVPPEKGVEIAARLQGDLEKRIAAARAGKNTEPWFDFNHKSESSSGEPTAFTYEPGVGIVTPLIWSSTGRGAVEGRVLRYFSPTFLLNDDGTPGGLPERGPLGALVPEPAFRNIGAIAASDADTIPEPHPKSKMKLIAARLKIDESRADLESLVLSRIEAMEGEASTATDKIKSLDEQIQAITTERDKLKGENDSLKTEAEDSLKKDGEKLVDRAVACGYATPKDDAAKAEIIEAVTTKNKLALKHIEAAIAAAETKGGRGLNRSFVSASNQTPATGHDFEKKAQQLVTAKSAATLDEAYSQIAMSDPDLYEAYQESLA